jgi:hypothetical protein
VQDNGPAVAQISAATQANPRMKATSVYRGNRVNGAGCDGGLIRSGIFLEMRTYRRIK